MAGGGAGIGRHGGLCRGRLEKAPETAGAGINNQTLRRAPRIAADALLRLSKNSQEVSEGPQLLRLSFVSDGFAGGAGC